MINDASLKAKLYVLLAVALGAGALSSGFLMYRASQAAAMYDRILGVEVQQEQLARQAQLGFKVQVQEWKNVLLRGHDRDQFVKYSDQFMAREAMVDSVVSVLLSQELSPEVRDLAEQFQTAHGEMGTAYRRAMADFEQTVDPYATDAQVSGMDRAPTALLDQVADALGVAALTESTGAALARERLVISGLLAIVFGLVLAGAWVLVNSLTMPLGRVVAILGDLSGGKVSTARLAMVRKDEIGQLGRAVDSFADRLQENVVSSLERIAAGDIEIDLVAEEGDELTPSILEVAAALRGMHAEVEKVIQAAQVGELHFRGNADAFQGAYYEVVAGMNGALDAFLAPVDEANRIMTELSSGDLRTSMSGEYRGQFAVMQQNVNGLAGGLRKALGQINEASAGLERSSQQLTATSDSLASAADIARQQAEGASAASTQTSTNVQMVAAAAEEMSNSIAEISSQLHEAVSVASDARRRVERTVEIIDYLGDASREIDEVVKVVNGIAEQTNLLALNATIEAARAGEAGKGFAVVASEVKQLASETGRATEEITNKIQSIQSRTGDAVEAIREISGVMDRINAISEGIAGAVEEQSAAVGEIAQNAGQAARGTEEMARSIAEVTSAVSQSAEGAKGVLGAADELGGRSGELQVLVGAYQI